MSIDSIENPPSEVVPNEGEESHPLEESCEIVEQNFEDHPSSIFSKDNPFIKNALNSLTPEQARNYKKIGEQIFRSVDFQDSEILDNLIPPVDDAAAYIAEGLKSGLHPSALDADEISVMIEVYGKEWYEKWGWTKEDVENEI